MTITRTADVRWPGRLACGCYVYGGRKYFVLGRGWCCHDCAGIERLMQEPPRPSERGTEREETAP